LQDVLVLLDLIGSAETKFINWFSKTKPLYDRLKDIGILLLLLNFVSFFFTFRKYTLFILIAFSSNVIINIAATFQINMGNRSLPLSLEK